MNVPRVGLGVIIRNKNKVLLLKRKGSHGEGTWAFIGGHLKMYESLENGARREVKEEIGISLGKVRAVYFTNDIFKHEKKHYITIFVIGDFEGQTTKIMEPDKIEKLEWFEWGKFPKPLFEPLKNLLKAKFNPFEIKI